MDELKKKQYGLVLKKKDPPPSRIQPMASVFGEDDEEDGVEKVDVSYQRTSASTIRVKKHAERLLEKALAEDPTILDYDASYDEIQAVKNEKVAEQKKADKERKSKYAEEIIKTHKRREIEKQSREERQQQKERLIEGEEFADKETFVTGAYRKQMEEVQKFREEEAYEARFNEMTSVEHQKAWQAGFGRTLLEDLARTGKTTKKEEGAEKEGDGESMDKKEDTERKTGGESSGIVTHKKRDRHERKRLESRSPSPEETRKEDRRETRDRKEKREQTKKSIYSDDEDGPSFNPPPSRSKGPQKNFEGELKPGLNKVVKKAETHSEKLRRQFTPTPPSSDDERERETRRGREREDRHHRERRGSRERKESRDGREDERRREEKEEKEKKEDTKKKERKLSPEEEKAARLERLKEILKQRNGPDEIAEFRARYFERKAMKVVVPPL